MNDNDYINKPPVSLPPGSMVIAYLRDSGGPNQEESIGQQERVVKEYCRQHGLLLSKIYSETASGRTTKQRNKFLAMMSETLDADPEARPRGLILWSYSRFSRDIVAFNHYLYGLIQNGVVVHSLTEEIPDGLAGLVMLSVKAYTNADFSIQLGKNIKRGIADRVKTGYSNGGTAPRGYIVVRELHDSRRNGAPRVGIKWQKDPELAPLVRLAWELRAQGKGYAEITKATQGKIYSNKNSWTSHFSNKSYLGIGKAGELEVPDHHEPLITWELWEAVKRVEAASPRNGGHGKLEHPRRIKHPSLLSGLSFCIYCGSAMVLHTSGDYRSYACGSRDRQRVYKQCTIARRVNGPKADHAIMTAVLDRILSITTVSQVLQDIQIRLSDTTKLDRAIADAHEELSGIARSMTRLTKLAEGTGDIDAIAVRLRELKSRKAELNIQVESMDQERKLQIPSMTPEALQLILSQWRTQLDAAHQGGDIAHARTLLSQFVKRIDLGYEQAIIQYTYPFVQPAEEMGALRAHSFFGRLPYSLEIELR